MQCPILVFLVSFVGGGGARLVHAATHAMYHPHALKENTEKCLGP
jgi:hypothetical protein